MSERVVLGKKQHRIVSDVIGRWQAGGTIDQATAERLAGSMIVLPFDWQKAARYAFLVAVVCFVVAIGAILADRVLMALLQRLFDSPAIVKCAFCSLLAAGIFWAALNERKRRPHHVYRNEAIFFIGVLAVAAALAFLGQAVDTGSGHFSLLFLLACGLYLLLGWWFPSKLVWVFGLLALGGWMGAETGYVSGYGAYFLGMNYPARFVLLGAGLAAVGLLGEQRALPMSAQNKVMGLLYLFIALWIVSIFGNYGDMARWHSARQYELAHWSILFGAVAVAAIVWGLRHDDGVLRGFGLTFLFINLYTRFFEYFWDSMHKALFFALLAASFWLVGTRAEAIWHLGRAGQPARG